MLEILVGKQHEQRTVYTPLPTSTFNPACFMYCCCSVAPFSFVSTLTLRTSTMSEKAEGEGKILFPS